MEQFGSSRKGYGEWLIANFFFYLLFFVAVGPVVFVALYLNRKHKTFLFFSVVPLILGVLGLVMLVLASFEYKLYFQQIYIAWAISFLALPVIGRLVSIFERFSYFAKPRTLNEQLEEMQTRDGEHEKKLLERLTKIGNIEPILSKLRMGKYIKGDDYFHQTLGLEKTNDWIVLDEDVLDQHMFILGATGAGKSETLKRIILEVLASTDRDIYFVDGKGDKDIAQEIRGLAAHFGRGLPPVFRMGHEQQGAIYDGFRGQPQDIYNRLVALIGLEEMEGAASYYADINRDLLQLICYAPGGPPRNFEQVIERLNRTWLLKQYKGHVAEEKTILGYDERALEGLAVRLRPIVREFSSSIGEEGFALEDVNCAIFSLRTQSVGDTARRFLGFLVEDIKDFIGKRQKRPALLIVDEYAQFPSDSVLALLSLARSSKLGVILATQDVATLGGSENRQRILANTTTQMLMRTNFPEDIGKMAGTTYQFESSIQHDEGMATGVGSARIQHTFKVDPNKVARLAQGEAFLIRNRYVYRIRVEQVEEVPEVSEQEPMIRKINVPEKPTYNTGSTKKSPELGDL